MRTTYSGYFEKGFMHGLAQVGKRRTRKQLLKDIVAEAASSVDMSRGLQGRGDWQGAVASLTQAAGIMDQAIDLAETLPGVNFIRTRNQAVLVSSRLGKVSATVDVDPLQSRSVVRDCEEALCKVIAAIGAFADSLNDIVAEKDLDTFSEDGLIKAINGQIQKERGDVGPLVRAAGKKGFKETKEDLEGKSGIKDPSRLAGWLKGQARKKGVLAEEHKDNETETSGEKPAEEKPENVIEPAGKIEKPGCA